VLAHKLLGYEKFLFLLGNISVAGGVSIVGESRIMDKSLLTFQVLNVGASKVLSVVYWFSEQHILALRLII